ncbi:MAG: dihydrolipoyl dehydrogenase family protein [Acidimicrobiales bacterium]
MRRSVIRPGEEGVGAVARPGPAGSRRGPGTADTELLVVGGGAAGVAAARAGARHGLRTVLVQDGPIGGECTFTGCVPSKTLIEAAGQGLAFDAARTRMGDVVQAVAGAEDEAVLSRQGITVVSARARFVGPRTLAAAGRTYRARRVVLATGSAPAVPAVEGLADVGYLTNESVFDVESLPGSLAVVGGGAIGCELAQVFGRFGATVHVVEAGTRLLPEEEPEASAVVAGAFVAAGIGLHLGVRASRVTRRPEGGGMQLALSDGSVLDVDALLVAVGRRPVAETLDPAAGGVDLDERGFVRTDHALRTSAPGVYAAGDVTGRMLFTHAADEMGRLAVRNAFARWHRRRFTTAAVPWVTFCDPEVARVGVTEAAVAGSGARVAHLPLHAVDRALAAARTEGFVKLIAGPRPVLRRVGGGELLGATIVAPRAGEMIHEVALAMRAGVFTGRLAQTVHAYPTWSTAVRQAAAQFFFEVDGRRARPATGSPAR